MSIINFIGNTGLLRIRENLFLKPEMRNPSGSVKDRAAYHILKSAGLEKGSKITEATSGNFGISLAMLSSVMGFNFTAVMPRNASFEREKIIRAYGGSVIRCDSMCEAVNIAEKSGGYCPSQFTNFKNIEAHYLTTGPEIYEDTGGRVDLFVAGVGSGGTIIGGGRYLREKNSRVKIVAVEPRSSPMLLAGKSGRHMIEGIGADFMPPLYDSSIVDEIISVSDNEAISCSRILMKEYGIFCGISSGAAYFAATELEKREENREKVIVAILPDSGDRYFSTGLFSSEC